MPHAVGHDDFGRTCLGGHFLAEVESVITPSILTQLVTPSAGSHLLADSGRGAVMQLSTSKESRIEQKKLRLFVKHGLSDRPLTLPSAVST